MFRMYSGASAPRWLPYPEIVEASSGATPYDILDSTETPNAISSGWVDKVERVMGVPSTEGGDSVVRHELAHVRWSPEKHPKLAFDRMIYLAVEDARINMAMEHAGLPVRHAGAIVRQARKLAIKDLESGDHAVFVLRAIASLGTDGWRDLLGIAETKAPTTHSLAMGLIGEVEAKLERSRRRSQNNTIASVRAAIEAAQRVADVLKDHGLSISISGRARYLISCGCCMSVKAETRANPQLAAMFGGVLAMGGAKAGAMTIAEPALTVRCREPSALSRPAGRRAVREGAIIRYSNRWFSDKAIFQRRSRIAAGAVLIDVSGSMRLDTAGVDAIVHATRGAALVAIYSGTGEKGELRIVAREGKRVPGEGLTPYAKGNLVDLPALEWLAKQPGPRIWVSDGAITGVGDRWSSALARACRLVCARHRVRRVLTAEAAAALLAGKSAPQLAPVPRR